MHYNKYEAGNKAGKPATVEVDVVVGGDGANSRVAREIGAGEYDYAIAFQERIRIPDNKMDYYKDLAEMYVGDDVSPDFYGWVFPKYDHVAVGALPAQVLGYRLLCSPSTPWQSTCSLHPKTACGRSMLYLKP